MVYFVSCVIECCHAELVEAFRVSLRTILRQAKGNSATAADYSNLIRCLMIIRRIIK
jgi:hypothetical protein